MTSVRLPNTSSETSSKVSSRPENPIETTSSLTRVIIFPSVTLSVSSFFFHAEDGIRDRTVTGVQTCALPISIVAGVAVVVRNQNTGFVYNAVTTQEGIYRVPYLNAGVYEVTFGAAGFKKLARRDEIGRASCRERVKSKGVGRGGRERRGTWEK